MLLRLKTPMSTDVSVVILYWQMEAMRIIRTWEKPEALSEKCPVRSLKTVMRIHLPTSSDGRRPAVMPVSWNREMLLLY